MITASLSTPDKSIFLSSVCAIRPQTNRFAPSGPCSRTIPDVGRKGCFPSGAWALTCSLLLF